MHSFCGLYDKVNRCFEGGSYSRFLQNSSWLASHLSLETSLKVHSGCVNSLCWTRDSDSTGILSGSDDRRLIISDIFTKKSLASVKTTHGDNIFSVRFLPFTGDKKVVSGAGDGSVLLTDLERVDETQSCVFNCACETGPVYECRPLSMDCSQVFLTCAEDGSVRRYDTRICNGCCQSNRTNPLTRIFARISGHSFGSNRQNCCRKYSIVNLRSVATTSIDLAEGRNSYEMAVGCSDGKVRIYDMRHCKKPFAHYSYPILGSRRVNLPRNKCQVTCVKYSESGNELLVNFSGNQIHLISPCCSNNLSENKAIWMTNNQGTTTDETENENKNHDNNEVRRIKRIRLRGDWTDTGPMARPNRESIIMIRRLNSVFNNLGISPVNSSSSSSHSSTSSESENNESSGESGDQLRLSSLLQSLVGRLSDQANNDDEENDHHLNAPRRDRESDISSEPDYDDDDEDDDDESILNAQCDDLHDINASASVARHRNRRPPTRTSTQISTSENMSLRHIRTFTGHRNSRTIIKECAFYGDHFVMSGSDCGHMFLWDKETGNHVGIFLADQHVVNCVQPHPTLPIIATSGIDHDIKIWMPSSKSEVEETAEYLENQQLEWKKILDRNDEMLRESQNTVTVLDPLLLGLLASISRARLNRDTSSPSRPDSSTSGQ